MIENHPVSRRFFLDCCLRGAIKELHTRALLLRSYYSYIGVSAEVDSKFKIVLSRLYVVELCVTGCAFAGGKLRFLADKTIVHKSAS